MDLVGPLPKTVQGFEYIVTMIDFCSRVAHAIPCRKLDSFTGIRVLNNLILVLGQPEVLVNERGQNFKSLRMFETCSRYGIKQIFVPAKVHKVAGRIERYHATLEEKLRKLLAEKHLIVKQWDQVPQESGG